MNATTTKILAGTGYDFDLDHRSHAGVPQVGLYEPVTDLSRDGLVHSQIELEKRENADKWQSSFIVCHLFLTGAFYDPNNPKYTMSLAGLENYLHDRGSHLSGSEIQRRIHTYATYCRFPEAVPTVREIGMVKAYTAIPFVTAETVMEVLEVCRQTPTRSLKDTLEKSFQRVSGQARKAADPEAEQQRQREKDRDDEVRTVSLLGKVGERGTLLRSKHGGLLFVPRRYTTDNLKERRFAAIWDAGMNVSGHNGIDSFFAQVTEQVFASLPDDTKRSIEQVLQGARLNQAEAAD